MFSNINLIIKFIIYILLLNNSSNFEPVSSFSKFISNKSKYDDINCSETI